VCIALHITVAHNIAQNRPDDFPSCRPDNHHCSDDVCLGGPLWRVASTIRIKMPGSGEFVFDGDPAPPEKRAQPPTHFLAHVYYGQTAGWMKTPIGTEVDIGPVRRGSSSPRKRGTAANPHPSFRLMSIVATVANLSYC